MLELKLGHLIINGKDEEFIINYKEYSRKTNDINHKSDLKPVQFKSSIIPKTKFSKIWIPYNLISKSNL